MSLALRFRPLALLALLACAASSAPSWAEPGSRTVIPLHGQLLVFQQPAGFVLLGEQQQGGLFLREALPEGEDRGNWTQMLTVLVHLGSPDGLEASPGALVRGLAAAYEQACPRSFATRTLADAALPEGHPLHAAVLGCGALGEGAQRRGEQVLMVSIKRAELYFTLQWTERSAAQERAPVLAMEQWAARFMQLAPLKVCDRLPGERAPYASCR
ncbi:MAG: hypothetical protein U1E77_19615 [Inhella sp.]